MNSLQKPGAIKATLLIVSSLTVMAGATIAPSLPQISKVFADVPNAEFLSKLILTMPALVIALLSPLMGFLVDRFGRIPIIMGSVILYAAAGSSGLYLNDIYSLLVGRALLGVAVAGLGTAVTTLVGDYFEHEARNRFLGLQGAFMALGGMVFVGAGGVLADIGWRYPFAIYFFSLVILPMVWIYLWEPKKYDPKDHSEEPSAPPAQAGQVWLLFITGFCVMLLFYLVPVQIPFFLKSIQIESNASAGISIAVITFFSASMSFIYRYIKPHFTYQTIYAISFLLMSVGFFVVFLANSFMLVLVGMMITGMGGGWMMPNTNLWMLSIAPPERRGRLVGALGTAFFLGQFFSPIVVEPLKKVTSLNGIFLLASIFLLAISLAYGIYALLKRSPAPVPAAK